jgi:hypothetical protein
MNHAVRRVTTHVEEPSTTRRMIVTAAISVLVVLALYLARLDRVAGLVVDDAWYVLLAKALADGDGFRLTSSAASQILPSVPPGFPALLSPVFWLKPDFPQNVLLLKAVSIVAMFGAGLATFWYVTRCRRWPWRIALAVSLATVVTPAFVFLATSTVMAECVFTFAQLAAVVVLDGACAGDGRSRRRSTVLAAVLAAATMLIKSSGAALIAASVLYLLKERRWRHAVLFAAVTFVCLTPWLLYARAHAPTDAERSAHGGSIAVAYGDSIRLRIAATPSSGPATPGELAIRVADNLTNVFIRDVGGILVPAFYRGADESGEEVVSLGGALGLRAGSMSNATPTKIVSLLLGVIGLVGFVRAARERLGLVELLVPLSIAMAVLVPYWTYRYVLPLAPFIFGYVAYGLRMRATADEWRLARILLLCVIGLDVTDHAQYISDAHGTTRAGAVDWLADSREVDEVLGWMRRQLPQDAAVASSNPALVYLRTGRKSVGIEDYRRQWSAWKALRIRYVVCLRPADLPDVPPDRYRVLYRTAGRRLWVIEI